MQEPSGRIKCDPALRALFKVGSVESKAEMASLLESHLSQPPPYTLEYTIKFGSPSNPPPSLSW